MKRMLLKSYMNIEPQEIPMLVPLADEVLIKVSHVGVCGSDISAFYGKHPFIPYNLVLGHEFSGYIEECGKNVKKFKKGDRVTVLPHFPCGKCKACEDKRWNQCNKLKVIGCQTDGAQAEYVLSPQDMVFVLPKTISMEDGALIEPIAVGYHGMKKTVKDGDKVLIMGAGTIGLAAMESSLILGAKEVYIADYANDRLETAKKLGATGTFDLTQKSLKEHILHSKVEIDVFSDCVGGDGSALNAIIEAADRGVRIVNIGVLAPGCEVAHLADLSEKELTFLGSNMYVISDYDEVIQNLVKGNFKTEGIVTHRFVLDDVPKMYKMIDDKIEKYIKLMIIVD